MSALSLLLSGLSPRSARLLLSSMESAAADVIASTPEGVAWLRSQYVADREARQAAAAVAAAESAAEKAAAWAVLPVGSRVCSGAVSPDVRDLPLAGLGRYVPAYFEASEPGTSRTTVLPGLGTDDVDAVISERVEIVSEEEEISADGTVTVSVVVRLWTGSVNYGTATGTATGALTDYMGLDRDARKAAEKAARQERSRLRSLSVTLGTDGPGTPLGRCEGCQSGDGCYAANEEACRASAPVCPVSGEDYRTLRGYVQRRAYGNAAGGSRSAHVRAGVTALGVPVTPDAIDDAASAAVLILSRWGSEGLPEGLSQTAADWREEGQDVRPLLLGSAARDGLRMVTGAVRPTALAQATSRYRARLSADPRTNGPDSADSDRGGIVRAACPVSAGGSTYVAAGVSEGLTAVVLQRTAAGALAFPALAALLLLDSGEERGTGGVAAVARLLLDSSSGAARRKITARLRQEWSNVQALHLPEPTADATEYVR